MKKPIQFSPEGEQEGSSLPSGSANTDQTTPAGRDGHGNFEFSFHGSKTQYLGLSLYNLLLNVLTLGIYYPWAKSAIRKFLWQETEVDGSRFEWHGTGKEMFRGFIKAYLILGGLFMVLNFGPMFIPPDMLIWVVLACYLIIIAIIPLAIHGMMRYRLSRSSLRGIHFGYRGNLGELYRKAGRDFFFTIITFGIYGAWLQVNIRKYVLKNARYGNVNGRFTADGGDLFWLSFTQMIFILITFYIYIPWAIVAFFKFYIENMKIEKDGKLYGFKSTATGWGYFVVLIKAFFITVLTLGICGPIASLMIKEYWIKSIRFSGAFDFNDVSQTEEAYTDATGDDIVDVLDLGF